MICFVLILLIFSLSLLVDNIDYLFEERSIILNNAQPVSSLTTWTHEEDYDYDPHFYFIKNNNLENP
jgi:hypothetical protein